MTPEPPDPPPVSPDPWTELKHANQCDSLFATIDGSSERCNCYMRLVDVARAADALRHQREIQTKNDELVEALKQAEWYRERMAEANDGMTYLRAALSTAEDTPRMAERTDRQPDQSRLARIRAGLEAHDRGDLNPNADMFAWESVAYLLPFAALSSSPRPQEPQPAEPPKPAKPVVNLMEALKKSLDSLNANRTSQEPGGCTEQAARGYWVNNCESRS